jgi:hypothetical protein
MEPPLSNLLRQKMRSEKELSAGGKWWREKTEVKIVKETNNNKGKIVID